MAIITTVTEEPTGAYADALPVMLHSVGVAGYAHRWVNKQLTGALGSTIPAWVGTTGTVLAAGSGKAPTIVDSTGIRAALLDGVDDLSSVSGLGTQRTIVLVMRVAAADGVNTGIFSQNLAGTGYSMVRTAAGQLGVFAPGSTRTLVAPSLSSWCVLTLAMGATTAEATLNAASVGTQAADGSGFDSIFLGKAGNAFGKLEIAEVLAYPTALSAANVATLYASLKKTYPTLP